jgi:Protein of unknown function (DUF2795)
MVEQSRHKPVAGVYRDDIARFDQALAGLRYPARKWQLIAHAGRSSAGGARTDARTIHQLWALPPGLYAGFAQVLAGAARTARGHPNRAATPPCPDRLTPGGGARL